MKPINEIDTGVLVGAGFTIALILSAMVISIVDLIRSSKPLPRLEDKEIEEIARREARAARQRWEKEEDAHDALGIGA